MNIVNEKKAKFPQKESIVETVGYYDNLEKIECQ